MKALFIILLFTVFNGCGGKNPQKPLWIEQSPRPFEAIGVVKAASGHSVSMQRRIAMLQAKAELSKRLQIKIYSELLTVTHCTDEACKKELYLRSEQESRNYLSRAKELKNFLDPSDGTYYLLIQIKP